jgi:hypothetical protein
MRVEAFWYTDKREARAPSTVPTTPAGCRKKKA